MENHTDEIFMRRKSIKGLLEFYYIKTTKQKRLLNPTKRIEFETQIGTSKTIHIF